LQAIEMKEKTTAPMAPFAYPDRTPALALM